MTLPPADAPIAGYMPALVRAARAHDPGAMCRLAFELKRCEELPVLRQAEDEVGDSLGSVARSRDRETQEFLVSVFASQAERRVRLESVCAGVDVPSDLKPWRLLRDAARAGHVPSMIRFATMFPVNYDRALDDLDALAAYRDESEHFLLRAAAAGNPQGALDLYRAYSGHPAMLFHVVPTDPVKALAYAMAIQGNLDDAMREQMAKQQAEMRRKMTKSQLDEAERMAAGLAPRYAGGPSLSSDNRSRLMESAADCAD